MQERRFAGLAGLATWWYLWPSYRLGWPYTKSDIAQKEYEDLQRAGRLALWMSFGWLFLVGYPALRLFAALDLNSREAVGIHIPLFLGIALPYSIERFVAYRATRAYTPPTVRTDQTAWNHAAKDFAERAGILYARGGYVVALVGSACVGSALWIMSTRAAVTEHDESDVFADVWADVFRALITLLLPLLLVPLLVGIMGIVRGRRLQEDPSSAQWNPSLQRALSAARSRTWFFAIAALMTMSGGILGPNIPDADDSWSIALSVGIPAGLLLGIATILSHSQYRRLKRIDSV